MEKETTYLVLAAIALYVVSQRKTSQRYSASATAPTGNSTFMGTGSSLTDIIKTASEAYRAYDKQEWEQSQAEKRAATSDEAGAPTKTSDSPAT